MQKGEIQIYKTSNGTDIQVKLDLETVWLDAHLIASLFEVNRPAIVKHIQNIYKSGELEQESTCSILEQVAADGRKRKMNLYNLDVIISVGYRVNSKKATQFRQWATQRLKEYLVQGYALNQKRLAEKQMQVEVLQSGIRMLHRALVENKVQNNLALFTAGLELLDQYDHQSIQAEGTTVKQAVYPTLDDYLQIINSLKPEFASAVFAVPKDQSFESAIAQIAQTFDGKELYPTLEEKAAVLLYLIVKNHAFADGNKRIGAACFLHFLNVNGLLFTAEGTPVISNETLAALTLFVAVSKPEEKDLVIKLIINMLNKNQVNHKNQINQG
jgi:death-on-curing family protein